jgi:hypothetical protein
VPGRLLESRPGATTVDGLSQGIGLRAAGSVTELQVTGSDGVPDDASAVVLNVTVAGAQGAGFVTVWPCCMDRPNVSSPNFRDRSDDRECSYHEGWGWWEGLLVCHRSDPSACRPRRQRDRELTDVATCGGIRSPIVP